MPFIALALSVCVSTALSFDGQTQTLREVATEHGAFEEIVLTSYSPVGLAELTSASDLIVEVTILSERGFLANSDNEVWTDYVAQVIRTLKPQSGSGPDQPTITIVRRGGTVEIEGRRLFSAENGFPPLRSGAQYVLFLRAARGPGSYVIAAGPYGLFPVTNGAVNGKPMESFREDVAHRLPD